MPPRDSSLIMNLVDVQGLIQNVATQRRSGELVVTHEQESRHLHFANGQIVAITGTRPDAFTRAICWTGLMTRQEVHEVIASLPEGAGPEHLLRTLLEGRLDANGVLDALDMLIEEEVTVILGWNGPGLTFTERRAGDPWVEAQQKAGVLVSAPSLLLEGLRRQDELSTVKELIPDHWDTLIRDPAITPPADLGEDAQALLEGWRDGAVCGSLLEHPRLPPFRATMALAALRRCGLLRVSTPSELVVQADNALALGQHRRAFGLYRRALTLGQENARIHLHIAELAERGGDRVTAAASCMSAANLLSDPAAAASALSNALRLGADREAPLSQLAAIHIQLGENDKASAALMELARLYEKRRAFDQAMQAVREAEELGADAAQVALMVARLSLALGDKEQAVLQLELSARAFHDSERIPEAITAWRELLRLVPGRCDYAQEVAELLVWSGEKEEAIKVLRASLGAQQDYGDEVLVSMHELLARLDPSDFQAHAWLASAYERRRDREGAGQQLLLAAKAHEKAGDLPRLAETLERILELDQHQVEVLEWLAKVRADLKQDEQAASCWCRAVDAALARGQRKEARVMLDAAIVRLPASLSVRTRAALVANREGDRVAALKHYAAAADLARGAGDPATARDMLLQLSRMRPDDVIVRCRLAEVAEEVKDPNLDRILADLVRVAERFNNHGLALDHTRKRIAASEGLAYEARSELVELLRRTGDHAAELVAGKELLGALLEQGEFEKAVEMLSRLVASHPKDAELVQQLAEAHIALDDKRQASRLLRHAVCLLQMEDRIADAKKALDQLGAVSDEKEVIELARERLDQGQAVDWEKLRLELSQGQRRRLADRMGTDTSVRRHATDRTRRPGTDSHDKVATDRQNRPAGAGQE